MRVQSTELTIARFNFQYSMFWELLSRKPIKSFQTFLQELWLAQINVPFQNLKHDADDTSVVLEIRLYVAFENIGKCIKKW